MGGTRRRSAASLTDSLRVLLFPKVLDKGESVRNEADASNCSGKYPQLDRIAKMTNILDSSSSWKPNYGQNEMVGGLWSAPNGSTPTGLTI